MIDYGEKRVKIKGELTFFPLVFCADECYIVDHEYPYGEIAINDDREEVSDIVSYCEKLFKTKVVLKRPAYPAQQLRKTRAPGTITD